MTEYLGGEVPSEQSSEWAPELARLTLCQLGEAVIGVHNSDLYGQGSDKTTRYAIWDDIPRGKRYSLVQLNDKDGCYIYNLRVYTGEGVETELYTFRNRSDHIIAMSNGQFLQSRAEDAQKYSDYVANSLRAALKKYNYEPPIAPPDKLPMQRPLTMVENVTFIRMAGCYALETPGEPARVLAEIRNLPRTGIAERDRDRLAGHLRMRREVPSPHDPWPETISYLQLPDEWVPGVVQRALFKNEPSAKPVEIPEREQC